MDEPHRLPKPSVFDPLYPGRFIRAGELLGKKVTLTIRDVDMEELVLCKTNGICLREMFGKVLSGWVGKRITVFEDTWNGEPCVRIWGSPDIAQDFDVEVALPRRRPFEKTMHKMVPESAGQERATKAESSGDGSATPASIPEAAA
jgi:hypothetical protein